MLAEALNDMHKCYGPKILSAMGLRCWVFFFFVGMLAEALNEHNVKCYGPKVVVISCAVGLLHIMNVELIFMLLACWRRLLTLLILMLWDFCIS